MPRLFCPEIMGKMAKSSAGVREIHAFCVKFTRCEQRNTVGGVIQDRVEEYRFTPRWKI
jgi:hypothetical protein